MFRFLTAGESHGKALVAIVEGMVAGLPLDEEYIAHDLHRRQLGYGRSQRMRLEKDKAEIVSGVRHGLTMGSPISLLISNQVWQEWQKIMNPAPVEEKIAPLTALRPGHADLAGVVKYGLEDVRPILERASARDTAARVAVGAIARRFLAEFGVTLRSHTVAIGGVQAKKRDVDWEQLDSFPLRCADKQAEKAMMAAIDRAKAAGDSLGGVFEVIADGVPIGLGSHVHWDRRLDGKLAQAVMSIPSVKAVEVGDGFALAGLPGSQVQDIIEPSSGTTLWKRSSNRAGGLEGGMSNEQPIVVRAAVKPISTLAQPLPSVDLASGKVVQAHYERADICIVPAAGVIGEAMLAIMLADCFLEKFGGDNLVETKRNYQAYLQSIADRGKH